MLVVGLKLTSSELLLSIQFSSVTQLCLTLGDPMDSISPGLPVHCQLLEFTQTRVHWVSDAIQPSHPLLSPSPPAINLASIKIFSRWPKYWTSASVLPMYIQDWFPLRWTGLISLQSKGLSRVFSNTIVQKHQLFGAQLSLYSKSHIHTWLLEKPGKTIALTRQSFVGKVVSLLFNKLSRLVITILPRSKCLLISWLQSPSAVVLEPKKTKSVTVSPSTCHEVMGPDAIMLIFWLEFKARFFTLLFHFHQEAF